jgi:CBS domain-containing protein
MTLQDAAQLMLDNHIGCLPVVDGHNQLVGIVTATDFLKMIADGKMTSIPISQDSEK